MEQKSTKKRKNRKKKNKNYNNIFEYPVGIDLGTSGCGYAYSFMNKDNIYHCDILGADEDKKVITEKILDDNNNVIKFGPKK